MLNLSEILAISPFSSLCSASSLALSEGYVIEVLSFLLASAHSAEESPALSVRLSILDLSQFTSPVILVFTDVDTGISERFM